jgi:hypothetical protein
VYLLSHPKAELAHLSSKKKDTRMKETVLVVGWASWWEIPHVCMGTVVEK